jgi:hypothetical protein
VNGYSAVAKPANDMPLSWTPRRRGSVYCAPACGFSCTWAAYQKAKEDAAKLCTYLKKKLGMRWLPRVWENLGWHYEVHDETGKMKVYPSSIDGKVRSYIAFLGHTAHVGGTWAEQGNTPELALAAVFAPFLAQMKRDDELRLDMQPILTAAMKAVRHG